jgi:hypothetical protein
MVPPGKRQPSLTPEELESLKLATSEAAERGAENSGRHDIYTLAIKAADKAMNKAHEALAESKEAKAMAAEAQKAAAQAVKRPRPWWLDLGLLAAIIGAISTLWLTDHDKVTALEATVPIIKTDVSEIKVMLTSHVKEWKKTHDDPPVPEK